MMNLTTNRKIVLASQSPRRKQLLQDAGFQIEVRATDIEESFPDHMPVREVPEYLAHKKALAAKNTLGADELIIASDCVVILDGVIYNKPADYHDAVAILKKLSGKMHEVVTGVCIMDAQKTALFSGVSKVYFANLSDAEIDYYIEKYQPYDKAGAYAIQEWIGLCKIRKIEGTYSNIMGLPMDLVYERLQEFLT
jgi:septum formation protein